MSKKVIHVQLNQGSIDRAMREIERYKQDLIKKNALFAERLKEYGIEIVNMYFKDIPNPTGIPVAEFDVPTDKWDYETKSSHVTSSGPTAKAVIEVSGNRLLYVEFGYGVASMSAPHPTGMYGAGTNSPKGHGTDPEGWWYYDSDGESHHTYGDVAYAPVWNTALHMRESVGVIRGIAREVFG